MNPKANGKMKLRDRAHVYCSTMKRSGKRTRRGWRTCIVVMLSGLGRRKNRTFQNGRYSLQKLFIITA